MCQPGITNKTNTYGPILRVFPSARRPRAFFARRSSLHKRLLPRVASIYFSHASRAIQQFAPARLITTCLPVRLAFAQSHRESPFLRLHTCRVRFQADVAGPSLLRLGFQVREGSFLGRRSLSYTGLHRDLAMRVRPVLSLTLS